MAFKRITTLATERRMECSLSSPNDNASELKLYRTLSKFSQSAWISRKNTIECCMQLLMAIKELLNSEIRLPDEFIFHLATTMKAALHRDSNRLIIKEQRSIPRSIRLYLMKEAFPIIYQIYATIGFDQRKR